MEVSRRGIAAGAALGLMAGIGVVSAVPAAAADTTYVVDCDYLPSSSQNIPIETSERGDEIVIIMACGQSVVDPGTRGDVDLSLNFVPEPDIWETYPAEVNPTLQQGSTFTWKIGMGTPAGIYGGPGGPSEALFWVTMSVEVGNECPTNTDPGRLNTCGAYFYLVYGFVGDVDGSDATPPGWAQAYARSSADEECKPGWNPSWDFWPNNGTGGWVCERVVPFASSDPDDQP